MESFSVMIFFHDLDQRRLIGHLWCTSWLGLKDVKITDLDPQEVEDVLAGEEAENESAN